MHRVSGVDGVRTCDARNAADALEGATRTTAGVLSMEPWLPGSPASLADAMRKAEADVLKRTEFHIQLAERPMYGVKMSVDDLLSVIAKK